jgi:hypothetical protein
VVLGDPHVVEAGCLGGDGGCHRGVQHGGVVLARKLRGEQKQPELHGRLPPRWEVRAATGKNAALTAGWAGNDQQSRSSGLWFSSWPRGEMNAR